MGMPNAHADGSMIRPQDSGKEGSQAGDANPAGGDADPYAVPASPVEPAADAPAPEAAPAPESESPLPPPPPRAEDSDADPTETSTFLAPFIHDSPFPPAAPATGDPFAVREALRSGSLLGRVLRWSALA